MTAVSRTLGWALLIAALWYAAVAKADAAPLRIVAVGASNTSGWLISGSSTYPSLLQDMLRARGIEVEVVNSGVPFDTTAGMLSRLDASVPQGTDIAILQPGGNDLRFFGSHEARAANIAEMIRRLRARSIKVLVYDQDIPWDQKFDGIHLTQAGHAAIAAALLPQVLAAIKPRQPRRSRHPGG